jgi:hypothetical protein
MLGIALALMRPTFNFLTRAPQIHFLMQSFCELKSQGKILFARLGFAAQRVLPNIPNQRLKLNLVLLKCAIKTQSGWI